jgi:transcriptional regulator with XRE-family HTH domain
VTNIGPNSAAHLSSQRRNPAPGCDPVEGSMSPSEFRAWRKSRGLKQKEAAEKLGLKKRMIQYYETGSRGDKAVTIPKTVELACYALSVGVESFDGVDVNVRVENEDPAPPPAMEEQRNAA